MCVSSENEQQQALDCFLCSPPADLVFFENTDFFALAGLGPIVDGYSVLAAKDHIRSMADMPAELREQRDATIELVRVRLAAKFGTCLVTEHGRMATCADDHDAHCFHAHVLLFPGVQDISSVARTYFRSMENFTQVDAALLHAAQCDEYLYVSPVPSSCTVFSGPLNIPRQLARILVGHQRGMIHLANWRERPDRQRAQRTAAEIRSILTSSSPSDAG